ncbi:peptidoglycan-binding protein [Nonomuraea longicatena]|uniref:Hint domain-containing protein n=1 Tax=Nonomuraea longicatena TaxID=83682 RepID=A0ABP4AUI2_9ACTN
MAIDLILRRAWNARPPTGAYTVLDSTKGVKVHYTGGRVEPGIVDNHDGCTELVRSIQNHHIDGNGWIDIGYCADEETEILTRRGWRTHREVREGDLVLTLDPVLGLSRWQHVLEVCVFPAKRRDLVRMEFPGHSSLTTVNHRWPVRRADGSRAWATTGALTPGDRIQVAAPCADLPSEPKWTDALVELAAWFWDGSAVRRPAHAARIRAALLAASGEAGWEEGDGEIRLPAIARHSLRGALEGDFVLSLTRAQLGLFTEVAELSGRPPGDARLLAAVLSGRSPTGQAAVAPAASAVLEAYEGEIWCPRTPDQTWFARRRGTVYFTGNTYVACPHRKVFEGRGAHHLPAANGAGLNSGHYAVLGLVGNAGLVEPPDAMLDGILDAIEYLRQRGGAGSEIKGHRDGYSTDCPGDPLYSWVRRGAPRPGTTTPTPRPTAPAFPGRLLSYPPVVRGDDVRTWQQQMSTRGWNIDVDGAYGAGSREVCRRFQRNQGIPDDGVVGPVTWRLAWEAPLP